MIGTLEHLAEIGVGNYAFKPPGNIAQRNPVVITTTSLTSGTEQQSYSIQLVAVGGTGTYSWVVTQGALPSGLTLSSSGLLSGVPDTVGGESQTFTVQATSGGIIDTQQLSLTIAPAAVSGIWFTEDWTGTINQSGGGGTASAITLGTAGPWGGTSAIQVTFPAAPASHQPQAGAYFDFPYDVDEFWVQTWYRFDSNWDTLPYWIAPDGTQTSNEDHKSMFVFERGFGKRWEWKIARYGMVASAATHDIHYQYFYDPPYAHPITQSEKVTHQQVYPNGGYYAPTDAWDNQWHEIRWHCKQGASSDGEIELWWDGVKVINATGLNTQSGGDFFRFVMGANRNSGPSEDMGFQVGPVNTWNSDPGW